ncbi:hypothetical protein KI688_004020 [Linnemannia hyalina]|uniref:Uncharacterized protein n=1 Tax=Linnemannia hyalina TaxID=64524 RepID=A0A9P7XMS9_9FUNG|nr:hypothetical protein KI688_004020 [Linnemannia hyalina]
MRGTTEAPEDQAEGVEEAAQSTQELDAEDSGRESSEEQGAQKQDASETEAEDDLEDGCEEDGDDDDADAEDDETKGIVGPFISPSNTFVLPELNVRVS